MSDRQYFHYLPQISDKTAGRSFIQCEGTQSDEDDIIYTVTSKQQINIVFPPQPTDALEVVTQVNESVKLNLTIEAFPLTTVKNLVWNIIDGNTSVKVKYSFHRENNNMGVYI